MINNNYQLINDAEFLYACDLKWWKWHIENPQLKSFTGRKFTQDKKAFEQYGAQHHIEYIESINKPGLSEERHVIHQGANSGYQAINLAYLLGAKKILLVGYDMKVGSDGRAHWFGHHPDKVVSGYAGWIKNYDKLAEHAKQLQLDIINCTTETALTCFKKQSLFDSL